MRHTPHTDTSIRSSPGPGCGASRSTKRNGAVSIGPGRCTTHALMLSPRRGEQVPYLPSDLQVLSCRHDDRAHRRAGRRQLGVAGGPIVGGRVDGDTEEAEPVGGSAADGRGVLPDPAGEGQDVDAARRRGHRRDAGGQPVGVDVEGQGGVGIAGVDGGLDFAHVAGSGEREQPGAVLQRRRDLADGQVLVLRQPQHQPRVDGARAGRHDQPFERREAHRGVDAAAADDGGERRAAPRWHVTMRSVPTSSSSIAAARCEQ